MPQGETGWATTRELYLQAGRSVIAGRLQNSWTVRLKTFVFTPVRRPSAGGVSPIKETPPDSSGASESRLATTFSFRRDAVRCSPPY